MAGTAAEASAFMGTKVGLCGDKESVNWTAESSSVPKGFTFACYGDNANRLLKGIAASLAALHFI